MKWLVVISVALVGAGGGHEARQRAEIRDEVCACKSPKCAQDAMERVPKHDIQSTPRSQRIAREMMDCLATIYKEGQPSTDPDAPTDEATDEPPRVPGTADPASAKKP